MIDNSLTLISVVPETLCRQDFSIYDRDIVAAMSSIGETETFCNFLDTVGVQDCSPELHQTAFLHIVTETVFAYPHNSYGEKTWKPIVNLRPFVLVSVPGSLEYLRTLGFQTFSKWWDESYDNINDPLERMKSIIKIIEWVSTKSLDQLKELYNEIKPVVSHNYNHYYNDFRTNGLKEFELQCQKNLLPR